MVSPLADVRVVEVANWMAAPSASAILADLGADVIKVEPLTGEPMRGLSRPAKVDNAFKSYDLRSTSTTAASVRSPLRSIPTRAPTSCDG